MDDRMVRHLGGNQIMNMNTSDGSQQSTELVRCTECTTLQITPLHK